MGRVRGPITMTARILFIAILCIATVSHAGDEPDPDRPLSDLPGYEMPVPDLMPGFFPSLAPPLLGQAALSLVVSMRRADTRHDIGGSLVLEMPFDGFTSRKAKRAPVEKHNDAEEMEEVEAPVESQEPVREIVDRTPMLVIRPRDARAAVAASQKHRRTRATLDDLDSMASRARYGSLLPTLRLRATRLVDESISLSPTSYDAERTTSRGGASLWLEARASWNLDRLVFASEEVRVTQLQLGFASKQRQASQKVVEHLFAWQRAVYAMHDPTLSIPECVQAWLLVQELAATLDLATGGWFETWSAGKAGPTPTCAETFTDDALASE